jgi:hypothetical protein
MARGAPMKRTRMRRRKGSTKYSRRERDFDRIGWVRTFPCVLAGGEVSVGSDLWRGPSPDPCRMHTEAHHAGEHGRGHKAPDDTVIPLCKHHHDSLTDRRIVFSGWPKYDLKLWEIEVIRHYQRVYSELSGDPGVY